MKTHSLWDSILSQYSERTEMTRRDRLRKGDRAVSSHYGMSTVKSVRFFGSDGQTTLIIWEGGGIYPRQERYDSGALIPRVMNNGIQ